MFTETSRTQMEFTWKAFAQSTRIWTTTLQSQHVPRMEWPFWTSIQLISKTTCCRTLTSNGHMDTSGSWAKTELSVQHFQMTKSCSTLKLRWRARLMLTFIANIIVRNLFWKQEFLIPLNILKASAPEYKAVEEPDESEKFELLLLIDLEKNSFVNKFFCSSISCLSES